MKTKKNETGTDKHATDNKSRAVTMKPCKAV